MVTEQSQAHRRFLYTHTMGIIAILGTLTAALNPALSITARHFTDFTDVRGLNAVPVIAVGIVFLLQEFANMESLKMVIVLKAPMGAIIVCMRGRYGIWEEIGLSQLR